MQKKWWQDTVVYQIYPKSFMDSNGDGTGDLCGILRKLDYIQALGVNVIWLCPINRSPMRDNGYDISDYYAIDPVFGNMEDLELLIAEAGRRGIRVLMDLVVNHVSDRHMWFQDMLRREDSPYRDYFIIQETPDGSVPNNFRSYFGDSVWERIGESNRFYFHTFAKEQPDLNWENPALRREIYDMMSFWLEKGIAGFRVDAIGNIKKSDRILSPCQMPPDAEDGLTDSHAWLLNQPGIEVFLGEMRDRVFRRYDSMTVAEVSVPDERLEEYAGENGYFSMVFDFSYADIDVEGVTAPCDFVPWDLNKLREYVFHSQEISRDAVWPAPYLENHDQPRSIDKYLPDGAVNDQSIKMLGALYFFLRGTPYIYQGQEIGMRNYPFSEIGQIADEGAVCKYRTALQCGEPEEKVMDYLRRRCRDNARTPMQWSDAAHAGFSAARPWIAEHPDYRTCNVAAQERDPASVLAFYRRMVWLRRQSAYRDVLTYGRFEGIRTAEPEDFVYRRYDGEREVFVVLNYSGETRACPVDLAGCEILLDNYRENRKDGGAAGAGEAFDVAGREEYGKLRPWHAVVAGRSGK